VRSDGPVDTSTSPCAGLPGDGPLLQADGALPVQVWAPGVVGVVLCLLRGDLARDEPAGDDPAVDDPPAQGPGTERRTELCSSGDGWWLGAAAGVRAGDLYGLRVRTGPSPADLGALLLDPAARAVTSDGPGGRPWAVVPDPATDAGPSGYDWSSDVRPVVDRDRVVVDEVHVRALTRTHPDVPEAQRGTYAGLAHPSVTAHLRALGVTTVELLPVHQFATEPRLAAVGLSNAWGYNTLAFNAPHDGYSSVGGRGGQVGEFKDMVAALHRAGLQVLLDVVYNHTAEQGPDGATTSLRGLADSSSYRHTADGGYLDVTGCGNTVDLSHPVTLRLVTDSLRYWVSQMHVDGFRFDLAPALCRAPVERGNAFDPLSPFLAAVGQDPVLRRAVLVAEPWDVGHDGYVLGAFPAGWSEWNDRFRDTVREFWRGGVAGSVAPVPAPERRASRRLSASTWTDGGDTRADGGGARADGGSARADGGSARADGGSAPGQEAATASLLDHSATVRDLASRLAGSSDVFDHNGRSPLASVNFVTAHDGFTLTDLVSYDAKHNEANGEDNRDGTGENRSSNHGVEGPTDDVQVLAVRARQRRNLLGSLLLAAGTPMLLGGDELGRTQRGNNNAYCLDDETTWVDWSALGAGPDVDLTGWVRRLLDLRAEHACLRPTAFAAHTTPQAPRWLTGDGTPMDAGHWFDPVNQTLELLRPAHPGGGSAVLVLAHAAVTHRVVHLPSVSAGGPGTWSVAADSAYPDSAAGPPLPPAAPLTMTARSLVVLVQQST